MNAKKISKIALGVTAIGAGVFAVNAMSKKKFLSDKAEKAVFAGTGISFMVFLLSGLSSVTPQLD